VPGTGYGTKLPLIKRFEKDSPGKYGFYATLGVRGEFVFTLPDFEFRKSESSIQAYFHAGLSKKILGLDAKLDYEVRGGYNFDTGWFLDL
jgi:hypothetical protein